MVFGKGQNGLSYSGKAPQLSALSVKQQVFKPKASLVLQRRGFCWPGQQASVSMGVSSVRLSNKVAPKYRILVHLALTRSIEAMQEGYNDDIQQLWKRLNPLEKL